MKPTIRAILAVVALTLTFGACSATSSDANNTNGTGGAASSALTLPLTDSRSGESFTLASLKGKPVYVENFATWCEECRHQLGNVEKAAAADSSAVFVAVSVETDLSVAKVAAYAHDMHFDHIRFAIMTPEFLGATNAMFGPTALNPPATPHFYLTASGASGPIITGFQEPAAIQAALATAAQS